jgi:hypothetical protein
MKPEAQLFPSDKKRKEELAIEISELCAEQ